MNIRGTTWTFTAINQQNLSLHCLPFQHSDININIYLSYINNIITLYLIHADKGFAPICFGHEPKVLLLHQSALVYNI